MLRYEPGDGVGLGGFSLSRAQLIPWVFGLLRWPEEQLLDSDTAAAGREALMLLCLRQSLPRCVSANRLTRSPCRDGTDGLRPKDVCRSRKSVMLQGWVEIRTGGLTSTIRAVGSLPWGIRISTWIHGVHLIVVLSP